MIGSITYLSFFDISFDKKYCCVNFGKIYLYVKILLQSLVDRRISSSSPTTTIVSIKLEGKAIEGKEEVCCFIQNEARY